MEFIDLQTQYQNLKSRIDRRIQTVLDHGKYIMGPEVFEFEEKLADFTGVKHVVTCANGTDALTLALMVLGVRKGDAIFCPTFTFFATAEAISFLGATPVLVDSENDAFNICPTNLKNKIEDIVSKGELTPKAIIAVDLFGLPANYSEIISVSEKYNLKLVEDAAQGFGGSINGKRCGSFGDMAITSFFPAKPLGCYGDGGAVFTNNAEYAELLRSYRVHGKGSDKYNNVRIGMNSRLDTLQAAILLEKLSIFPEELVSRNLIAATYSSFLDASINTPKLLTGFTSSWAQYCICVKDRDTLISKLEQFDIPTAIYYSKCLHQQSVYKNLNYCDKDFPVAVKLSKDIFSLPMHPYMSQKQVENISHSINSLLN